MVDEVLSLIQELCDASGPSGYEGKIREIFVRRATPLADSISQDRLGSAIATKVGQKDGPKVLLAGHMDEVGFLVTRITDDGFIKFQQLGGWWDQVMLAQRFRVVTGHGEVIGVIGSKAPHVLTPEDRAKVYVRKDMFLDVGASSKEEAQSFGIRPGDPIVPDSYLVQMANPKLLMAKAWDDRYGVAAVLRVLEELQGVSHPNVVLGAATVQEEVGLRGATTTANMLAPDVAFALDVGIAGDTPGMGADLAQSKLGEGPTILIYDSSMIPNQPLRDFVVKVAEEEGIPIQFDSMAAGGTDAGAIQRSASGVPALVIGAPARYVHSHAAVFHRDDFDNAVKLLVSLIKRIDSHAVEAFRRA